MEKKGGVCIIFLLCRVSTGVLKTTVRAFRGPVQFSGSSIIRMHQDWGLQSQKSRVQISQNYANIILMCSSSFSNFIVSNSGLFSSTSSSLFIFFGGMIRDSASVLS